MRNWLIAAAAISAFSFCGTSQACNGCGGGFGYGLGFLYNSLDSKVPYFAAHPPVYYSYPVPRTYGHSPFAYPPHFRTPEVVDNVQPVEITNPYFQGSTEQPAAPEVEETVKSKPTAGPLVVENPYVKSQTNIMQVAL